MPLSNRLGMMEGIRAARRIADALLALGLVGWFGAFACNLWLSKLAGPGAEFPLAELQGVALDSEGRIYCGAMAHARVQVYDRAGCFLRGMVR